MSNDIKAGDSETLIPTMNLRYEIREYREPVFAANPNVVQVKKKEVLQQMFYTTNGKQIWRDVSTQRQDLLPNEQKEVV